MFGGHIHGKCMFNISVMFHSKRVKQTVGIIRPQNDAERIKTQNTAEKVVYHQNLKKIQNVPILSINTDLCNYMMLVHDFHVLILKLIILIMTMIIVVIIDLLSRMVVKMNQS